MKIGVVITETWGFFSEVYEILQENHTVSLFQPNIKNTLFFRERLQKIQYQNQLANFLHRQEVVFFEWASEILVHATRMPKKQGIITRLHRYEMYQWAKQINWQNVDRVIVVSQAKEDELNEKFPETVGKTIIIPEAVNLTHNVFDPQPYRKQLGILCHLSPRKRVYELIEAFADYELFKLGFHLHIGGGEHPKFADYYRALHYLVDELNLNQHITFHNHIQDSQKWYKDIDIFISNSYSEGLQVSPMEAMACGVYCLSHQWDGARELLQEKQLFLTNREMVKAILDYDQLNQEEKLMVLQTSRRQIEERFDIMDTRQQILKTVEQIGEQYQ